MKRSVSNKNWLWSELSTVLRDCSTALAPSYFVGFRDEFHRVRASVVKSAPEPSAVAPEPAPVAVVESIPAKELSFAEKSALKRKAEEEAAKQRLGSVSAAPKGWSSKPKLPSVSDDKEFPTIGVAVKKADKTNVWGKVAVCDLMAFFVSQLHYLYLCYYSGCVGNWCL